MNIRETVEDALTKQRVPLSQYKQYTDPVIEALETRESEVARNLIMYATEQGLSHGDAVAAIRDCGLEVESPSAVPDEDPRIAAMENMIETMQAQLRELREG